MTDDTVGFAELTFAVDDATYPAVRLSRALECRLELLDALRTDDGLVSFVRLAGCDPATLAERAGAVGVGGDVDALQAAGNEFIARFSPPVSVVETLTRLGVPTESATTSDGVSRITAVAPGDADVQHVVAAVVDTHPSVEFVGKRTRDVAAPFVTEAGVRSLLAASLTDRQWEAVALAHERGYFEQPRRCSQSELAAAMGISQKTFSQHLRAATRKLLDVLFEE